MSLQIAIYEEDGDAAIANRVPGYMSDAIKDIPASYRRRSAQSLQKTEDIEQIDEALRTTFWLEVNRAAKGSRKLAMVNVYGGICSLAHFRARIDHPGRLAFILSCPLSFEVSIETLLTKALSKQHEILDLDLHDEDGNVIEKVLDVQYRLTESIIDRAKGTAVHRSANLEAQLDANSETAKQMFPDQLTAADANKEIARLLEATSVMKSQEIQRIIDVEASDSAGEPGAAGASRKTEASGSSGGESPA